MKRKYIRHLGTAALSAGICVCTMNAGLAATNYIIDTYPVSTGTNDVLAWQSWWGGAPFTVSFDPTMDANDDTNSGSVRFDVDFTPLQPPPNDGNDRFMIRPLDTALENIGGLYGSLEFDLYWDPNSALDDNGTFCKFNHVPIGNNFNDWEWNNSAYYVPTNLPAVWHHVVHPFPVTYSPPTLDAWSFYLYEFNGPGGENHVRGPMTFWVDNIMFVTNPVPPAPPQLAIQKAPASQGLQMYASLFNNPGSRQGIRAVNPVAWVSSPDPVKFSITVAGFPDAGHNGFETHVWLVPGAPGSETAPDHNEPNVAYIRILNNADGTATASFRYKTNSPGLSGDAVYDPNTAGVISNSTPLGTWSVTFTSDTNVTLSTPGGTSTNFTLPEDVVAQFNSPVYFYLGVTPNAGGNITQSAQFSRAQIVTGTTTNLDDSFSVAPLDTFNWTTIADDPNSVFIWPADADYWVSWTLPDTAFVLQNTTDLLDDGSWSDMVPAVQFQNNIRRQALLTNSPAAASYFRLQKP